MGHLGSRESQIMLNKSVDGCELNCLDIHFNNFSMMPAESLDIHRPTDFICNGHAYSVSFYMLRLIIIIMLNLPLILMMKKQCLL